MNEMPEQRPLDPDELANELDAWLGSDSLPDTPDPLLETAARLSNAPHPVLDAAAFARIQQRVMEHAPNTPPQAIAQGQYIARMVGMVVVGFVIVLLIALIAWAAQVMQPDASPPETTPNAEVTAETEALATDEVPTITATSSTPTATVTQTPTPALTAMPTITTPTKTITTAPNVAASATPLAVIVVTAAPVNVPVTNAGTGSTSGGSSGGTSGGSSGGSSGGTQPDISTNPDSGDWDNQPCDNPPPPWATANGWHRRCGGQPGGSNPGGNQPGNNGNNGNGNGNNGNNGNGGGNGNGNGNGGGNGNGNGRGNNNDDDD
jgi:hypothetical protein